jgi:integrase
MASVSKRKRRGARVARWRASIKGADGAWHERAPPKGLKGYKAVQAWADAEELRQRNIREGKELPPSTETLGAAAARYLHSIRTTRGHRTVEGLWRCRILPVLGAVPVSHLRPAQVDQLMEDLKEEGYADNTRLRIRSTLGACYEWLVRGGAVSSNPVRRALRIRTPPGAPKVLSLEQVEALAAAASWPDLGRLFLFAFYSICRPGEVLASTWSDVRLPSEEERRAAALRGEEAMGVLQVTRSMVGADTTKTKRPRVVVLPPPAVALLNEMYAEALARANGGSLQGVPLFLNKAGGSMKHRGLSRAMKVCLRKAGLPGNLSPKTFRSSGETRMIEQGVNLAAVTRQAGHNPTTAAKYYLKVSETFVADGVRRAFPSKSPPPPLAQVVRLPARERAALRWHVESVIADVKR